ncbi:MAG TPA: endonuclease/exonuclease/phosphatase family protein [Bacteroidales bacterium]|nr:endonuclease/exonuclease/phosphatase family protein [Bacteroidales bacterium]
MKTSRKTVVVLALIPAVLTIIISLGSVLSRVSLFSGITIIKACSYVTFLWVLIVAFVALLIFALLRWWRTFIIYFSLMFIFSLSLFDYSLYSLENGKSDNKTDFKELRVMAYNIRYFSGGIENICRFIRGSKYDVVFLSECVLNPGRKRYLQENLPEYIMISDEGHDLSLLSKYPVVNSKVIELPTYIASLSSANDLTLLSSSGIHRSFIHAVVNIDGEYVNLLSLRLIAGRPKNKTISEGLKWGEYLMDAQEKEIEVFLKYLRQLKGPVIFGGDLNIPPTAILVSEIEKYTKDTYLEKNVFGGFTFNTAFPTMRLDYIFHSADLIPKSSRILNVRLSDHFPVEADFLIKKDNFQTLN